MSDKWQGNKRKYMGWVRDYARHFLTCPNCGAASGKYCLPSYCGHNPKDYVCPERWKLAYAEVRDPARKRDWPKALQEPGAPEPVAPMPRKPKHSELEFLGRKQAARKLREALAADGVIMRKEGALYIIVVDGVIRGPMSLGAAVWWADSFWKRQASQAA